MNAKPKPTDAHTAKRHRDAAETIATAIRIGRESHNRNMEDEATAQYERFVERIGYDPRAA